MRIQRLHRRGSGRKDLGKHALTGAAPSGVSVVFHAENNPWEQHEMVGTSDEAKMFAVSIIASIASSRCLARGVDFGDHAGRNQVEEEVIADVVAMLRNNRLQKGV